MDLLNGTHPVAREMKKYIATPWCQCSPTNEWKACAECKPPMKSASVVQSHGGDLFQHSQWSALYLTLWYERAKLYPKLHQLLTQVVKSKLFTTVISDDLQEKIGFLQLCGFLHDIGKGGDGEYDMYAEKKYAGKGDQAHPEYSKNYILNPGKKYNNLLAPLLEELFMRYKNPTQARMIVVLCAAVHWDFGKLNIPDGSPGHLTPTQYIKGVREMAKSLTIYKRDANDFITLIKLSMVVSCADIASAYNVELLKNSGSQNRIGDIAIAKATHLSKGSAWTEKEFNIKHPKYIRQVLALLSKQKKKTLKK